MSGRGITTGCPWRGILDGAEELVNQLRREGKIGKDEADRALGGIALNKRSLDIATQRVDCPGVCVNHDGQVDCPVREPAGSLRSMAAQPWDTTKFTVGLESLVEESNSKPSTGQYL